MTPVKEHLLALEGELEELHKSGAQHLVVRLLGEGERPSVLQVLGKDRRELLEQEGRRRASLHVGDELEEEEEEEGEEEAEVG